MQIKNIKATIEADKKYKTGKIREKNYLVILNAAEKVFALHGFKGASMMAIAHEAGLPKANIHYYFKSKSLLYSAVLESIINEWNSGLENMSVTDDPATVLRTYIKNKVILACRKPQPSKLFATEIISGAPYLSDYIKNEMRVWLNNKATIFEEWIKQGKMNRVDPKKLMFMIWSSTQHYADFEKQVLISIDESEYSDDEINRIYQFISGMILKGCGLA